MKNTRFFVFSLAALLALAVSSCNINIPEDECDDDFDYYSHEHNHKHNHEHDYGIVVVINNSNRSLRGSVWTDSKELFCGTIGAWERKTFCVPKKCKVYTDFECEKGCKSNPSGNASEDEVLFLEL